jgi:hypothetical protein
MLTERSIAIGAATVIGAISLVVAGAFESMGSVSVGSVP